LSHTHTHVKQTRATGNREWS